MVTDVLLTPETYQVLARVPLEWWDEAEVSREICIALGQAQKGVRCRLQVLRSLGLIERRRSPRIEGGTQIRKIAKD